MPCPLTVTFYRVCAIVTLALVAGGVHSVMVPIRMAPDAPEQLPANLGETGGTGLAGAAATQISTGVSNPATAGKVLASQKTPGTGTAKAGDDAFSKIDITLDQARALFLQGVLFVDARAESEYVAKHVEGALHLPLEAMDRGTRPPALDVLDPGGKIVIYCGGGDCHASHDLAIRLNALGYKNCYVLKAGFPAWEGAGYETATGADPVGGGGR